MDIIPYGRQSILDEDERAVLEVLRGTLITQGPQVEAFESVVKNFVGAKHAVAVSNGTAALHLAAMALGVKPGDKVLVPPITFAASANCIRYCGGDVEFVDIDSKTLCIDLDLLEDKLKKSPKGTYRGIVCVDFTGFPLDMERMRAIADQHGLWIIEDGCHALGGQFRNSKGDWVYCGSGLYADATAFSFHPVKHVATGEGGMVTTNNPDIDSRLRQFRTHGITKDPMSFEKKSDGPWYYEMQDLGYNYRIPDILCALGISQMKRIEQNLARRRQIAEVYLREFQGLSMTLPWTSPDARNAYHLFVIQTDQRLKLYNYLAQNSIYCQVHYVPVHKHPYYERLYGSQFFPVSEKYYSGALSLPMYHSLSEEKLAHIVKTVKNFFDL